MAPALKFKEVKSYYWFWSTLYG